VRPSSQLGNVLRAVHRRYRVPSITEAVAVGYDNDRPSTTLAIVIERVREAVDAGRPPGDELKRTFMDALARLIDDAMRLDRGDPAFQATVLRYQSTIVREYASLAAHADEDRRAVRAAVNAVAHPAKLQRMSEGKLRDALTSLHALAAAASWRNLADVVHDILNLSGDAEAGPGIRRRLQPLLDGQALQRLARLDVLATDEHVQQYQSLWSRQGPRAGSATAMKQGSASRQRGADVEAQTAQALQRLALHLCEYSGTGPYHLVTSMRSAPALPGRTEYAKSEWDVVLLRQVWQQGEVPVFDLCLLVEAKASVDAATTDLPRLLRGLQLLASADCDTLYPFETQQGVVHIRGTSLATITADAPWVAEHVLYCSDAPAETAPRLLSSVTRMQLLSSEGSVAYASSLSHISPQPQRQARGTPAQHTPQSVSPPETQPLAAVWESLLNDPRWKTVRQQYSLLRQVRDLMVHVDDLSFSANQIATDIKAMPDN